MSPVNVALLLIRIASSLAFLYHGSGILFGAFGGAGPQGFAAFTHLPLTIVYLVGLAQIAGGVAVLLGVFTRVGAACLIVIMLGAIFMVHLEHGFDVGRNGFEYALTQLLIALALVIAGPGSYSLASHLPAPLRNL